MTDIAALRAALERATPGEWHPNRMWPTRVVPTEHVDRNLGGSIEETQDRDKYAHPIVTADYDSGTGGYVPWPHRRTKEEATANAELIALLHNNAPALLAAWEERERLRKALEPFAAAADQVEMAVHKAHPELMTTPGDETLCFIPLGNLRHAHSAIHPTQEPRDGE